MDAMNEQSFAVQNAEVVQISDRTRAWGIPFNPALPERVHDRTGAAFDPTRFCLGLGCVNTNGIVMLGGEPCCLLEQRSTDGKRGMRGDTESHSLSPESNIRRSQSSCSRTRLF